MRTRVWNIGVSAWCGAMLCLVGCGSESTDVAGSSLETENSVAFSVSLSNGSPAAHAKVIVRPASFLAGANQQVTTNYINAETDENGFLKVNTMDVGSYIIEARNDSLKGFEKIEITKADTGIIEMPLRVQKPGALSGKVNLPDGTGSVTVSVRGLDYSVQTDTSGLFEFESLPEGKIEVVAFIYSDSTYKDENGWESHVEDMRIIGSKSAEIKSKKTIDSLEIGEPEPFYALFADFENGTSGWHTGVSQYAEAKLESEQVDDRDGWVAHFTSVNDSALNWALMGYAFKNPVDFSGLDSVVFWAKGTDHISVSFDVNADSTEDVVTGKSWTHLDLDSVWTRYCVTPADMLDSSDTNGENRGWDAVKTHITHFSLFSGPGTSEFWIDDIEFFGIKKSKLK
ncbi:MAG: carboxypeptidase regulatory-like domain-containing protein [Fibrobacter sp.]|nr:carboxypeptidase regulatory-like domain-containing protein [Fibrobacter sp.]